jgi:hypothetical protein
MSAVRQHLVVFSAAMLAAVPAFAHPVHVAEDAGHTHWLAVAAVGGAVVVAIVGYARGSRARRRRDAASADAK